MKSIIADALYTALAGRLERQQVEQAIEIPPNDELGDYAFPCFPLAKVLRKNPAVIAGELAAALTGRPGIAQATAVSGYLNVFVDRTAYAADVLQRAAAADFGRGGENRTVVVEYGSPNTNKPLHLGHLRNLAIGESVARLVEQRGNRVVRTSMNNDRGVHICRAMLTYRAFGGGATPQSAGVKGDHLIGDYYVLFNQKSKDDPTLNERAQEMLQRWEAGDAETMELWRLTRGWVLDGIRQTYALFGIRFDKEYYESEVYTKGRDIVNDGLARGVFVRLDDGATVVDLESEGLGQKVLLRSDGTAVYIVQDLFLAGLKHTEFSFDTSLYVVGNEQEHHFRVLTAIFRKLGFAIADRIHHVSYGMVELPEGRMKSREGTVVDADDLIADTAALAREEVSQRYELSPAELELRSLRIALAALKYQLLKVDTTKNMVFDPKRAISFEGDTGPYLLYSYARAGSILRKAGTPAAMEIASVNDHEARLVKRLALFPQAAGQAAEKLSPSILAGYAFGLAQQFNEFYHECPVLKSEQAGFRLELVRASKKVLGECLRLLGIEVIEEM